MEYKIGSVLEAQYQKECALDIDICQDNKTVATIRIKAEEKHFNNITNGLESLIRRHLKKLKN